MAPPKSKLFKFVDDNKPTMDNLTKKCPCKWCKIPVAMNTRDLKTHYLKICKKIPIDRQDEVARECKKIGKKRNNNKSSQICLSFNNSVMSPAPGLNKSVSRLNVATPANDNNSNSNNSISHNNLNGPAHKKRKLNCGGSQSNLLSHFQRPINAQNFDRATMLVIEWLVSLPVDKEILKDGILNDKFDDVIKFLCPSFFNKYNKQILFDCIEQYRTELNVSIYNKLRGSYGCIGINLVDDLVEIYALCVNNVFFLGDFPTDEFKWEERKEIEEDKPENCGGIGGIGGISGIGDISDISGIAGTGIQSMIAALYNVDFKLIGIKTSSNVNNDTNLLSAIKKLSLKEKIIRIRDVAIHFDLFIENILNIDCVHGDIKKLDEIIEFITNNNQLKEKLENEKGIMFPEDILGRMHIIAGAKKILIKFLTDLDEDLSDYCIFSDKNWWRDINQLDDVFGKMRELRNILYCTELDCSMSKIFAEWCKSVIHYEKYKSPLFNRYDFKNDFFQTKLTEGLEQLFASPQHESVFKHDATLYSLCGLINPAYRCGTSMVMREQTDQLLRGMVSIHEYNEFAPLLVKAIRNSHPFEQNKWTSWDKLAGSREYNDFGLFGQQITSISGKSLDMILKDIEKRDYYDKFCGLNMDLEKNKLNSLK